MMPSQRAAGCARKSIRVAAVERTREQAEQQQRPEEQRGPSPLFVAAGEPEERHPDRESGGTATPHGVPVCALRQERRQPGNEQQQPDCDRRRP
jgi:hypothetical protein